MSEAVPFFKDSKFWKELTKEEKDDVFKAPYLSSWVQNNDVSSIKDIDISMFLYMNLEMFEDVYSNEGSLNCELQSLENHSFRNSTWKEKIDIKLEDILFLIENTGFSASKKFEIIKIYIDSERIYKEFQDKIGACEEIVKKYYYLVEDRFNRIVNNFKADKDTKKFLAMANVMSLKDLYSKEIIVRFSSIQYNGGGFRLSYKESVKTKIIIGIMLFDLCDYSMSFEDSKDKIIEECKAIGDETRFTILSRISERPYYVKELADEMDLTSASISHHLSILFQAGFIEPTVKDRKTYYNIKEEAIIDLGQKLISMGNSLKQPTQPGVE